MNKDRSQYYFLILTTIIGLVLLPFAIVKRSFKDWVIVYLVSFIGNFFADKYLVSKGYLKYPIKLFRKYKIHLPFDYIHYPLLLLYYNQWTLNSKPIGIFAKLMPFVIPQTIIETIAAKKTKLITWKKGWTWYHSFISLMSKFLLCRGIIALIRVINKGKISI
ncbi:CBO0543 family protein [Caldalkalibacillus mannanilyticus]|uniref:CBO0543 family protein n=1 Tax=Caldalkalibacillus mannanilyticus TaxID=1418 RepID=UPI0004681192|nr:CBO0543 family protein [Caldalkalibacillus mannanilyticus]